MQKNITGIRLDFQYYVRCLQESGLAGPDMRLTNEGVLALRTGLGIPQPFTECIKEQILPADDASLSFALAGGFAEMRNEESWMQNSEFETGDLQDYYQELIPVHEKMKPVLARVRKQMLRFGILTPEYDLSRSVVLLAWKKGRDMETLARNAGVTTGVMMKLIYKTKWLSEQIAGLDFHNP